MATSLFDRVRESRAARVHAYARFQPHGHLPGEHNQESHGRGGTKTYFRVMAPDTLETFLDPEMHTFEMIGEAYDRKFATANWVSRGLRNHPGGPGHKQSDHGRRKKLPDPPGVPDTAVAEPTPKPGRKRGPVKAPARKAPAKTGTERREVDWATKLASGETVERRISGGVNGDLELVRFGDGSRAVVKVGKSHREEAKREFDAEELGARVAEALGLNPPSVHRSGDDEAYFAYIESGTVAAAVGADPSSHTKSRDGRLIGLLDALIENPDRHEGNWFIGDDGSLIPIDHGLGWQTVTAPRRPKKPKNDFLRAFVADGGGWRDNDLSADSVAALRPKLEALRGEFKRMRRANWHTRVMAHLDEIQAHAKGTVTL